MPRKRHEVAEEEEWEETTRTAFEWSALELLVVGRFKRSKVTIFMIFKRFGRGFGGARGSQRCASCRLEAAFNWEMNDNCEVNERLHSGKWKEQKGT